MAAVARFALEARIFGRTVHCDGHRSFAKLVGNGMRDAQRQAQNAVHDRYLRVLFVQAAWVVLVRIKNWERYGLKSWIEAAKRRLHHNVLAIALANKLARIAWAVLAKGRAFELTRTDDAGVRPA